MLGERGDERAGEVPGLGIGLLLEILEDLLVTALDGIPGDVGLIGGAERELPCMTPAAQRGLFAGRARTSLAISIAPSAASTPLFPCFPPARSSACSTVSTVSTPKST